MKKWLIGLAAAATVFSLLFLVTPGKTRTKSYYSGDAIAFNDRVYVATTNTGSLELFRLDDKQLNLVAKLKPYNARFNNYGEFYDAKLSVEANHLYVYAVSNYTIYKYEVSGNRLNLVVEKSNTYWEWLNRIDKFGNNIVTVSAKGVKVYNQDLEVIVAHDFKNTDAPYNIASDGHLYLNVNEADSRLEIYNTESRTVIKTIPLNFKYSKGNRRAFIDASGYIYAVDDYYAKKFDQSGKLLGSFKHLDYQGFDIVESGHTDYVYFSDGIGVVKLDKEMKQKDYAWTGNMGGYAGWAMGLKAVYAGGDKIVIFNNSNILVLDANLNKIAATSATEEAEVYPAESLFLKLDKNYATPNSDILVSGGGYQPGETLEIAFNGVKTAVNNADSSGRFSQIIKIPTVQKGAYDIRVTGQSSKLHYSISFQVQ